ncbi:hypothetical protein C5167_020588, partial [Papaver somniferum]
GANGKPHINHSVTRGFCKQLLANALANLENHNKYALGKKEPIVDIDGGDVDNQLAVVYIEDLYKYYKLAEEIVELLSACPAIAGLGEDNKPFICTMDSIGSKELEVWGLLYTKNLLDKDLSSNNFSGQVPSSIADLEHPLTL